MLVTKSAVHGDLLGVIGFTSRHTFRCVETAVFLSVTQGLLVSGRSPTRESPPWMYLPKAQQPENSTIDWCLWWSLGEEPLGRGKCRWGNLKKVKVNCLINEVQLILKRGSWVGIWMQGEGIKRYISRKARDACLECGKDHVHQFELRSSTSKKTNPRIGWKESMNFVDRKTTVSCKTCAFTQSMEQWFVCVVISTISLCTYTWDQGNHPWMKKICDFLCHFTIPYQPSSRFYSGKWLCKCRQVSALYIFPRRQRVWLKIGYPHIETQHDICQTRQRVWLNIGHLKISWLIDIRLCLTCSSIAEYWGSSPYLDSLDKRKTTFQWYRCRVQVHTPQINVDLKTRSRTGFY